MKTKLAAFALLSVAVVTLVGCGSGSDESSTTTTTMVERTVTLESTTAVADFAPVGGFMLDVGEAEAGCTRMAIAAFDAQGVLRITRVPGPNAEATAGDVPPAAPVDPAGNCGVAPVWYEAAGPGVPVLVTPAKGRDPRQNCLESSTIDLLYSWPASGINVQVCEGNANALDAAVTDVIEQLSR